MLMMGRKAQSRKRLSLFHITDVMFDNNWELMHSDSLSMNNMCTLLIALHNLYMEIVRIVEIILILGIQDGD